MSDRSSMGGYREPPSTSAVPPKPFVMPLVGSNEDRQTRALERSAQAQAAQVEATLLLVRALVRKDESSSLIDDECDRILAMVRS